MSEIRKEDIIMGFVAMCIEEIAHKLNKDYQEVFHSLDDLGLIDDYIVKHYETLHTESRKNIVEDILETKEIWEKNKWTS